ncbi:LamG-like jellyroll fold domain-containing protein [Candidatus Nanohalovita haloferacivicina]|uniref:LamG-like jellyroll fold domain-containing protein n=1 Tax=Candidatus Nanohalovita haloferacivicina TaxID=2978046 RepID=UPI00325FA833|nr:LamG domain-containing protein [Candidatus Nanohalobia archaeon BNXNv]
MKTDRRNWKTFLAVIFIAFSAVALSNTDTGQITGSFTEANPLTEASTVGGSEASANSLNDDLLAYYRFDNPKISEGYSIEFDGVDDGVNFGGPMPDNQDFTYAAWFRMDDSDGGQLIGANAPCWTSANLFGDAGNMSFAIRQGSGGECPAYTTYPVSTGEWHQATGVADTSTGEIKLYLDGQLVDSDTGWNGSIVGGLDEIGIDEFNGPEQAFTGEITNVRVYNRTLSSNEAQNLYRGIPVSREGLRRFYRFNEGPGECDVSTQTACLKDYSPVDYSATPTNFNDNNFDTGSGWHSDTPLNTPLIDDLSGNKRDAAYMSGMNGTLENFATEPWHQTDSRTALNFSAGGQGYVNLAQTDRINPVMDSFSISVLLKANFSSSDSTYPTVFQTTGDGSIGYWGRGTSDSYFRIDTNETGRAITYSYPNAIENYTRVTVVVDREEDIGYFYKDNELVGTDAVAPDEKIDVFANNMRMGYDGPENANISLDQFLWWRKALTTEEREQLFSGEVPKDQLVLQYEFNEGDLNKTYNTAGLSRKGILNRKGSKRGTIQRGPETVDVGNSFTVSAWSDLSELGSGRKPAKSCYTLKQENPRTASGFYWIKPGDTKFEAYCDMDRRGGGWTMLMKIKGQSTTFQYDAAYWENNQSLNLGEVNPRENTNTKLPSYHLLNVTQIRGEFPEIGHNMNETLSQASTVKNLFSTKKVLGHENSSGNVGQYGDFDKDEFAYQDGYQDYGYKLNGCNSRSRVRWGWIWNNEDDECGSSDAGAGIGLTGEGLADPLQSGSWATCCANTPTGKTQNDGDGEGDFPRRAILWAREDKPSDQSITRTKDNNLYTIEISTKSVKAEIKGQSQNQTIRYTGPVPPGKFHVSLKYGSSKASLYIDGEKVKEKSMTLTLQDYNTKSTGLKYSGEVDEYRIYNRSLSDSEIQKLSFQ